MAESKEKSVLIDLGVVRIKEYDSLNVVIERLEEVVNPVSKDVSSKWRFKGYSDTISKALKQIVSKELMIDKNAVKGIETHLKQIEDSNEVILKAIERGAF
ncbi:hypothetical protein J1907_02980 [Lysinibacillus sphaericus]|uniref:hypothetical protein n=1 Tax=Lysinibacillus sphaericus TaxID=1421 RepID=UPI0005651052|nr:hypothetical protein [Lysinibacillus sphaericus]QTB23094.1 hypothetical protein J1907_02980 [Lysinibacillus sphaericus]